MDIQTIWSVAGSILASVGGAGVIICAVSGFLSNQFAKRYEIRLEQRLNKELEEHRSRLEQKRYLTEKQFDKEYDIYYTLSHKFFHMIVKLSAFTNDYINPLIELDEDSHYKAEKTLKDFLQTGVVLAEAQDFLYENAAFIPKDIFEMYDAIYEQTNDLFWDYHKRISTYINGKRTASDLITEKDKQTAKSIESEFRTLNDHLREHLNTIYVAE